VVSAEQLAAAQNGDQDALVAILRAIEHDLYKTAYYMLGNEQDARDATQDALIRICRNITKYETKATFRTWTKTIVTNLCIDQIRRRKEAVSIEASELIVRLPEQQQVEHQVMLHQMKRDVAAAVNQLDEQYRAVIVLRYVNQCSYEEISETLGLPLNTVKSNLFRAKTKLQRLLKDYEKGGGF
jgi:RNA polymerase sigma-70 factor (ECF subfamily)